MLWPCPGAYRFFSFVSAVTPAHNSEPVNAFLLKSLGTQPRGCNRYRKPRTSVLALARTPHARDIPKHTTTMNTPFRARKHAKHIQADRWGRRVGRSVLATACVIYGPERGVQFIEQG